MRRSAPLLGLSRDRYFCAQAQHSIRGTLPRSLTNIQRQFHGLQPETCLSPKHTGISIKEGFKTTYPRTRWLECFFVSTLRSTQNTYKKDNHICHCVQNPDLTHSLFCFKSLLIFLSCYSNFCCTITNTTKVPDKAKSQLNSQTHLPTNTQ